jgi:hypothetical protein
MGFKGARAHTHTKRGVRNPPMTRTTRMQAEGDLQQHERAAYSISVLAPTREGGGNQQT